MTDELKPCPFCGHDVEWHTNDFDGDSGLTVFIECPNEDCSLYQMRGDNTFGSESEAAEAWNRRSDTYALGEAIEKFQALDIQKQLAAIKHLFNRLTIRCPDPAIHNATANDLNAAIEAGKEII